MARLTVVLALACAGLASAEPDVCSLTGSDDECDAGLHCLAEMKKPWTGLCLDKKTYCKTYKFSHYGSYGDGKSMGKCSKKPNNPSRSSSGGGGVRLPTDLKFDTPIQIMCIGDSITRGGHGGEIRDPDEEVDVPKAVPDLDAEGQEVPGAAEGHAKIYHQEFTLEKANYCSKMGIMLDGHDDIDVYNLGVSGATAQSNTDIPWVDQPAYDDYKKHYRCDVAIVQLGTNDAKEEYWNGGSAYKQAYKNLLQNDIMQKCSLVLLGLPPPTQCSSDSCRFGDPDSSGGLGDGDICCPDAWESAAVINVELPEIVMQIAKELNLPTIPFREAIGEYHNEVLEAIRSYELADQIHPNEFGYLEMARQAVKVLDPILKKSLNLLSKTDEATTGGKWAAGLAVVAVGGLFAVFAMVSRGKGRRTARVLKEGYGAADPAEALLPVA